jgi:hypothetical protein
MKKHHERPSHPPPTLASKPAPKPAMKAAPAKPAPSLVDVKILVGQMKGMLTWMSKERAELQNMMAQVQSMLSALGPSDSVGMTAESTMASSAGMTAEATKEAPGEHGDPVISGASSDDESIL